MVRLGIGATYGEGIANVNSETMFYEVEEHIDDLEWDWNLEDWQKDELWDYLDEVSMCGYDAEGRLVPREIVDPEWDLLAELTKRAEQLAQEGEDEWAEQVAREEEELPAWLDA